MEGGAVALAGPSGTGKSTLAAALAARGHRILADNVCAIDTSTSHGPWVLPGVSFVNLWHDSIENAQTNGQCFPHATPERMRPEPAKYQVRPAELFSPMAAVPLRAVFCLRTDETAREPRFERLRRVDSLEYISCNIALRRAATPAGLSEKMFRDASRIAAQTCVGRLDVRHNFRDLAKLASFTESLAAQVSLPV
jgi:energy-coupling factor transporter ATP-binding protein EcfA2